jgi:hypothetical protein
VSFSCVCHTMWVKRNRGISHSLIPRCFLYRIVRPL